MVSLIDIDLHRIERFVSVGNCCSETSAPLIQNRRAELIVFVIKEIR